MSNTRYRQIAIDGLWKNNPGLVQLLGLCPLMAVTTNIVNGIGLGLATLLALVSSSTAISSNGIERSCSSIFSVLTEGKPKIILNSTCRERSTLTVSALLPPSHDDKWVRPVCQAITSCLASAAAHVPQTSTPFPTATVSPRRLPGGTRMRRRKAMLNGLLSCIQTC